MRGGKEMKHLFAAVICLIFFFASGSFAGTRETMQHDKESRPPEVQKADGEKRTISCRHGTVTLQTTALEIRSGDSIDLHVTTSSGTDRLGNIDIYFGAGAGTFLGGTEFFRGRTDEKGELSVEWVAPTVQANSTFGINIEAFEIGYRAAREPIAGQDCWFDIEVVVRP